MSGRVFDSSDHPGVDSSGQIEKFQEKALMELQDYVQKTYPDDTYRYISHMNSQNVSRLRPEKKEIHYADGRAQL